MSFSLNTSSQLTIFDPYFGLTPREQKFLDKSWAKYFSEYIFPKIDEKPYAVLYDQSSASRPNTPVNILIGALIIKELTGQSDDELMESLMFDIRYQYALHTTSYKEQPISDRSLGRFRERCTTYETKTGNDLLHNTVTELSKELAEIMRVDLSLKRMDSLMVASNMKRMSRLELAYTCTANLVKAMDKAGETIPEEMKHYLEDNDRNLVIYHNHSDETSDKITKILKDISKLEELCGDRYDESSEYQLIIRFLKEQTVKEDTGSYRLRTKEDGGMDGSILQNPSDPDATFREKAGKQYRGYVANVTEATGDNGSIITDYQVEKNTYSDAQFMRDALNAEKDGETKIFVTDGAYTGSDTQELARDKGIDLVATNLTGRKTADINADFQFNEDGTKVLQCPGGFAPKSCSYSKSNDQCTVSFRKSQCEHCPFKDQCNPKPLNRVYRKHISAKSKDRALQQRNRKTEEFSKFSNFRNGVETLPSILRRKYGIDHMPVRGLIPCRFYIGCKVAALNVKKFIKSLMSQDTCAPIPAIVQE